MKTVLRKHQDLGILIVGRWRQTRYSDLIILLYIYKCRTLRHPRVNTSHDRRFNNMESNHTPGCCSVEATVCLSRLGKTTTTLPPSGQWCELLELFNKCIYTYTSNLMMTPHFWTVPCCSECKHVKAGPMKQSRTCRQLNQSNFD